MSPAIFRAAVWAEVKRAERYGRRPDLTHLAHETGWPQQMIVDAVALAKTELQHPRTGHGIRPSRARALVMREIIEAEREGRNLNRMMLRRETGLPWSKLEWEIHWAAVELKIEQEDSAASGRPPARGASAAGRDSQSPTHPPAAHRPSAEGR
jgi:hypothetical protein